MWMVTGKPVGKQPIVEITAQVVHFSPQLVYVIPLQLVLLHILKEDVASTDILIQPVPRDVIESINPEPGSQDAQITRVNLTLHNGRLER